MHQGTHLIKVDRNTIRVHCQTRSLTLGMRIDKLDARHWAVYSERWENNQWEEFAFIDQYPAQAVALVEAGAFLERMYQTTGRP